MDLTLTPKVIWNIRFLGTNIPITITIINTWIVMLVLIALGIYLTRDLKIRPKSKRQVIAEFLVNTVYNVSEQIMGDAGEKIAPYIGVLFAFLFLANISGLFGMREPTADVNTTFALSLITFTLINYYGVKKKGAFGRIKKLFKPFYLMFPLNVISELALPVSLAFRLFGNIIGGSIILSLVYSWLGYFAIGIPAVLNAYFDLFVGFIQAFIFIMLTLAFIQNSRE